MEAKNVMAVSKAVRKKDVTSARDALSEGRYEVDMLVRLMGEVVVGRDTQKTATTSLMSVEFLLLTLRAAGVTRGAAMASIKAVASGYLNGWTGSDEDKEMAKRARKEALGKYDPKGEMSKIFDGVKAELPSIPVRGSVKFEGTVEEVQEGTGVVSIEKAC